MIHHLKAKNQTGVRITAGTLKGRCIPVPDESDLRPTRSLIRQAVFDCLPLNLVPETTAFWDFFSGSGLMALEAWSRGFRPVHGVEGNGRRVAAIGRLCAQWQAAVTVHQQTLPQGPFPEIVTKDLLVFSDPPYASADLHQDILLPLARILEGCSVWYIAELSRQGLPFSIPEPWQLWKEKRYGQTLLCFLRLGAGGVE